MENKQAIAKIMRTKVIAKHRHGEVYGTYQEVSSPQIRQSMNRKLGPFIKYEKLPEDTKLNPYYTTYKYYPTAPRVLSFKRRQAIKESLPTKYRKYAALARKLSKKLFLTKTTTEFNTVIKNIGYKDATHFWRVNKYQNYPIPKTK